MLKGTKYLGINLTKDMSCKESDTTERLNWTEGYERLIEGKCYETDERI